MSQAVKILLVDDERRNLDALEAILDEPDYLLLRASDADAALHALLEHQVAAIVLDIKMPGVSGFELARLIQGTKKFRQIPILFLTAYLVDEQDKLDGYGAGAVDYLTKPVNPQILRHKVGVFAELFRKSRALAELNEKLEERVAERTAELEASEAALKVSARQKDEFLAILAHELRNPLAPLRTGLDLLLRVRPALPGVERTMASMNRQLDHMVRLIDDLLDVSRINCGKLELKTERVELGSVIERAIDGARTFFERRHQTISVDVPRGIPAVADSVRVVQILGNLLHNASKFTPEGGTVRVELSQEPGQGVIRIVDNGVGVSAGQLDEIFQMFAHVEPPGTVDRGLGIGLALARSLAELHGGTLTASSPGPGRGTTFTLALPILSRAAEPTGTSTAETLAEAAAASLRILLIEDNEDIADTMAAWLEHLGHQVEIARSGVTGVEMVRASPPELVFCDLGLPGMDGLEVCRAVRALGIERQPMMVAVTGWGRAEDLRRTSEAGFDRHLVKPVQPDKLHEILGECARAGKRAITVT